MNILLTGASGLIGSHVKEYLQNKNAGNIFAPESRDLDVTSKESVDNYFSLHIPDIIIHCAAYTDVSGGELQRNNNEGSAWKINVDGTKNIVSAVRDHDAKLIHISTDVIFSGKKDDPGPYAENHPAETNSDRVSWYGWTKAEAEKIIVDDAGKYAIVRISNPTRAIYEKKLDYVRKITAAYDQKKMLRLFDDQHLTLTFVNEVSDAIYQIIQKKTEGIFHASSSNLFTPFELGEYVLEKTRGVKNIVQKSSIEDFLKQPGNNSRYPQFGGLDVRMTEEKLGLKFRTWQEIIQALTDEKAF